ncbi:ABC transporter permease [Streptomyces anulatus]|uniref:ABC transporter permease n=1 Tax=Streptomyces anulatus TaxID=1892 RepID=UPI00341B3727
MTAPTTTTPQLPDAPVLEPKARFTDLLAAEWMKLWSLRSNVWAFAATMAAVLVVTATAAYGNYQNWPGYDEKQREYFRTFGAMGDSFTTGSATVLLLGAGAIGALSILSEYTTGMIRTTFTAVPARRSVMAAKVGAVTAATTIFGMVMALVSFCVAQGILSGRDAAVGLGHDGVLRLLLASALLAPVSALIGMALAAIIRHSVLTIVATVVLFFVVPSMLNAREHLSATVLHMTVLQAWQRLTYDEISDALWPWTATGAWTVLGIWALVAAVLVVFSADRRDQ